MEIKRIQYDDPKLYSLIAPLVMNPEVLKGNNNYPFKNFPGLLWYVAVDDGGEVVGFMPLKESVSGVYIDNYYISDDNPDIIDLILDSITDDMAADRILTALVHKRHVTDFQRNHFIRTRELSKYDMMQYSPISK